MGVPSLAFGACVTLLGNPRPPRSHNKVALPAVAGFATTPCTNAFLIYQKIFLT